MHLTAVALVLLSKVLLATAQDNASSTDLSGGSATIQIASPATGSSSPGSPNLGTPQGPWVVNVGSDSGALVLSPSTITAQVGDTVQFVFYGRNHSVAVSSFDAPCVALPKPVDGPANDVFYTGFMPTSPDGNPVYTVNVASADPIWLFCSQGDHCRGGMVGVINPPQSGPQNLSAYAAKAAKFVGVSNGNGSQALPSSNLTSPSRTASSTVAQSTKANVLAMNRVPAGLIGVALLFWALL